MQPDFERRFGGLRRLYGPAGAQAIFDAHVVVVGIGAFSLLEIGRASCRERVSSPV